MDEIESFDAIRGAKKFAAVLLFCVICIVVNFIGSQIAHALNLPLYLDCLGIVLASVFGGYIPGILVGYVTNLVTSLSDPVSVYYSLTSVLIAVASAFMAARGWFRKPLTIVLVIVVFAFIGGVIGSLITWSLFSLSTGEVSSDFAQQVLDATGMSAFWAQICSDFLIDLVDKGITVLVAVLVMRVLPDRLARLFDFTFWQQTPLRGEQLQLATHVSTRGASLRTKIIAILACAMLLVAVVTISISYVIYHNSNVDSQGEMALGIANLVVDKVDGDRIDEFLQDGEDAPGYREVEGALAGIRESSPYIQYVYVYKIAEDGCHVVFDPDTEDEPGSDPGEIVDFDQAFMPYLDDLLKGKQIDPVVSNETYGWLLTAYQPILDNNGACAAYAAVDISMSNLVAEESSFLVRISILLVGFFVLICTVALWLVEYGLVLPINSIAQATAGFAFDSESSREGSVGVLRDLDVHTGDEVENLYQAVTKTSEDTVQFIADSHEKAETIERMQDNLIMVMADLVESRDQFTGDHVRKTAAYTKVIMEEMRREGMYPDVLTDEFIANVVKSAPLHDVGKIEVSDAILNKPGRLTDEEFAAMRNHTLAGERILNDAKGAMSDAGYLDEARRLAAYHHEKWNGTGYPEGRSGQNIPLCARIMAVADIFSAITEERPYRKGMDKENALKVLHENIESGGISGEIVELLEAHYEEVDAARDARSREAGKRYFASLEQEV